MAVDLTITHLLREYLGRINPDRHKSHQAMYEKLRRDYIAYNEQSNTKGSPISYLDSKGLCTVGIGFCMGKDESTQEKGAIVEWDKAFPNKKARPDFDKVREKKLELTQPQINQLVDYSLEKREKRLRDVIFKGSWEKFKPNERLAIEDLYYNGGEKMVYGKYEKNAAGKRTFIETNFHKAMTRYAKDGDPEALKDALTEVKYNSNRENAKGLQNRRDTEAEMLNSPGHDLEKLNPAPTPKPAKKTKGKLRAEVDEAIDGIKGLLSGAHEAQVALIPSSLPKQPGRPVPSRDEGGIV